LAFFSVEAAGVSGKSTTAGGRPLIRHQKVRIVGDGRCRSPEVAGGANLERLIATTHDDRAWFRGRVGGEFMSLSQLRQALAARR
jgi:hypothetical protein